MAAEGWLVRYRPSPDPRGLISSETLRILRKLCPRARSDLPFRPVSRLPERA